jgi:RNA polymerase sigma factor (sigma-70 family)
LENANPPDWNDLLKRAQEGNQQSLTSLFSQLTVTLNPIIQCRLRGWSSADQADILQETLITLYQKLNSLESNPHKYAARILRNKIGDAYRRQRTGHKISIDASAEGMPKGLQLDIEEALSQYTQSDNLQLQIDHRDLIKTIKRAIRQLSSFCQTFFLGILEQRDRREVFEVLQAIEPELSRGTFRKRIFECRQKLKALIQRQN